ncbi:MAG TPA: hypothetical protein IAB53_05315, partial [Candidatus Scybalocola faecipullorum]|nr:hypothetical protein [Candidatus Scybalocola faecipullorum]
MMGNSEFRIDRKKILLVSHEMTYTGAPKSLLKLACILQKCAYEVEIWTLKDGNYISEFEKNSFSVTTIDFPENASERLSKNLKRFDLVIANTIFCAQFARFSQMFTRTILYIREAANISNLINGCFLNAEDISKCNHII